MESKIFCLVAFLALSAGVAYTQAQQSTVSEKIDTSTTPVASPSNGSEPNTTVSTAPTTAAQSTVTVPTSAVPSTAVPSTEVPTKGSNSTGTSTPTVVPTAGGTTEWTTTDDYNNGTTPASTPSPTPFQPCTPHSFDAASFVGGIVLGLGVCIIVFFIYKWYQSRHPTAAPYQQF